MKTEQYSSGQYNSTTHITQCKLKKCEAIVQVSVQALSIIQVQVPTGTATTIRGYQKCVVVLKALQQWREDIIWRALNHVLTCLPLCSGGVGCLHRDD